MQVSGIGAVVDKRYVLEDRLGIGGFGTVWRARITGCPEGEPVVLKIMRRATDDPTRARRFEREAALLAELDHPRLVRFVDAGSVGSLSYLAMEYAPGKNLARLIGDRGRDRRPFALEEVLTVMRQLVEGLRYIHGRGVIHRDLKPQNIMIDPQSLSLKIVDFGVAKLIDAKEDEATTLGRTFGSVAYMAPEQIHGTRIDQRVDVFALGCLLYEMLTLRRPWTRTVDDRPATAFFGPRPDPVVNATPMVLRRILTGPRPRPTAVRHSLPRAVDEVLGRALAARSSDRYETVQAFFRDLEAALIGPDTTAAEWPCERTQRIIIPPPRPGSLWALLLGVVSGTLFMLDGPALIRHILPL